MQYGLSCALTDQYDSVRLEYSVELGYKTWASPASWRA
jgi:hypothetical protein